MQQTRRVDLRILLAAGLACLLAACSSGDADNYQERSVDEIYNAAMELLLERNYDKAAIEFEEVERQHPYSIWASKAQVMGAYAYFRRDRYDEAVNAVDRFIQLHPTSPDAPYAYYLKALAYYEQIVDVGRDQRTTLRALDSLEDVVRRFPETQYARDASLKLDLTRDHLAGKEMDVGRFYLKRGDLAAAVNRFKRVIEQHQTTSHVPEALLRLSEAYTALGLDNEARRMTAILGHNYPGSPWYADAYELVEDVQVADFPRPDERAFYQRWFDPDAVIAKAERREVPDLRPDAPKPQADVQLVEAAAAPDTAPRAVDRAALPATPTPAADAAAAVAPTAPNAAASTADAVATAAAAPTSENVTDVSARAPARPTHTPAERAALAAEAESQALAAKEAGGEWRRAAAQATTEDGRRRAEANVALAESAVTYWEARRAVAEAATPAAQATAEQQLAEVSVGYWQAALGVAEDDLSRRHASDALAQAEASRDYWRANGKRPSWLERTLRSAI